MSEYRISTGCDRRATLVVEYQVWGSFGMAKPWDNIMKWLVEANAKHFVKRSENGSEGGLFCSRMYFVNRGSIRKLDRSFSKRDVRIFFKNGIVTPSVVEVSSPTLHTSAHVHPINAPVKNFVRHV